MPLSRNKYILDSRFNVLKILGNDDYQIIRQWCVKENGEEPQKGFTKKKVLKYECILSSSCYNSQELNILKALEILLVAIII